MILFISSVFLPSAGQQQPSSGSEPRQSPLMVSAHALSVWAPQQRDLQGDLEMRSGKCRTTHLVVPTAALLALFYPNDFLASSNQRLSTNSLQRS